MSESLSQNNPEHSPADSNPEQEVFVAETISADEHNQIGELAQQQHDEKILAKQSDVSEALSAVHAMYGEDIVDSYQDANGRTWVEDSQGRHTMLRESMAAVAVAPANQELETAEVVDASANSPDGTIAFVEELIDEAKAQQEPEAPEQDGEDQVYDEKTAIKDLSALGIDKKAIDLILDIQYDFQKRDFDDFLDPKSMGRFMERVGLPRDRQDEFTAVLEKVHTGLYPRTEQKVQKASENEVAEFKEIPQSDSLRDAQMKLVKLSGGLAAVGEKTSGRIDHEIKRDADRVIQDVIDTLSNELRAKMKRGEEVGDTDPLRRSMKYLRDLDTRFNAGDIAARLRRINQLTGFTIDK